MIKKLTCIICPKGCELVVEKNEDKISVKGNACKRGEQYAINELENPVRSITAAVRVSNKENTMLSVKTIKPVNKDKIKDFMKELNNFSVTAPIKMGQKVCNIFNVDVVATKEIV